MAAPHRARHAMSAEIRDALEEKGLRETYDARPPYQRNDYIGWLLRCVSSARVIEVAQWHHCLTGDWSH